MTLRGPGDVAAALPYQLGYHPQDSVVVVAMHRQRVGMIERLDLPPAQAADQAAQLLVRPLRRERPEAVVVVAYEVLEGAGMPVLDALRRRLGGAGIPLLSRIVVRDGRWFDPDCGQPCCPADGTPIPQAADIPAVAELVGLEISPLPTRSSVAATVARDPALADPVAAALQAAGVGPDVVASAGRQRGGRARGPGARLIRAPTDDRDVVLRWLRDLSAWAVVCDIRESAPAVADLSPGVVAGLVASLHDLLLRDGLIAWFCPETLPLEDLPDDLVDGLRTALPTPAWREAGQGVGDGARAAIRNGTASIAGRRLVARLQALCRAVPDSHAAGVLTVLANVAWWLGDGAVAREALDRALRHAPDYRLAQLTEQMVDLGVRPRGRSDSTHEPP